MECIVNGQTEMYAENATVADMLSSRGHDPKVVVVECNGQIIPAAAFADTRLCGGDVVEIVQFVGGG